MYRKAMRHGFIIMINPCLVISGWNQVIGDVFITPLMKASSTNLILTALVVQQ